MAGHLQLYDGHGKPVLLGRQLGAGGEGAVFDVHGAPQFAAKWYKHLPNTDKASKLIGMARSTDPALSSIAAWPAATLHKSPSGPLVGFLMPKLSGYQPIHTLYSPANRKVSFPNADWAFLIHAARNLSSAIATIHARGHVIGDINQGNVLIAGNATVKLIDCDSFQIRVNGRNFLCEVGVPEFTPPELHGQKMFAGVTRNANHDAFGLAVLIFHLIFMGRHPFAGRFLGKGDKSIEDAIREFRFAFGQAAPAKQMAPPPHSLSLLQTSVEVASLFERAFSESAARAARPAAQEWLTVLDKFRRELATCTVASGHKFHRALKKCPWCEIQRNAGPDFFISVTLATGVKFPTTFDLAKTWAAITALAQPDMSALNIPTITITTIPTPMPPYLGFRKQKAWCLGIAAFVIAAATAAGLPTVLSIALSSGMLGAYYYAPNAQERRKRRAKVSRLESSVQTKQDEWAGLAKNFHQQFLTKLKALENSKNRYETLSITRQKELEQLEQARRAEQQKEFLERHFIKDYKMGLGKVGSPRFCPMV
jgi:DNA-binding helix-hairpin-helix protein with protein kinase domain